MNKLWKEISLKWWSPAVTHLFGFIFLVGAIPYLAYDLHHSHDFYFAEIGIVSFLLPLALTKIHESSLWIAGSAQVFTVLAIYSFWPQEQLGNRAIQIADFVLGWILCGFLLCALLQMLWMRRKSRRT